MKVFICSPFRGKNTLDQSINVWYAEKFCLWATLQGHNPFAPHLFYTRFLDDAISLHRELGIKLGLERLRESDVLWAFCKDYESASEGMKLEILEAISRGIPVVYITKTKSEILVEVGA